VRGFEDSEVVYGQKVHYGDHNRVNKLYGRVNVQEWMDKEIAERCGKMLVGGK